MSTSTGAPTRAMWTDLGLQSDPADDVRLPVHPGGVQCRLHHLQLPQPQRRLDPPYGPAELGTALRGADVLLAIGGVLAFVNAALMGAGADVWGAHTLWTGLIFAALIIPVFVFRHYIQDKGVFPKDMVEDMHLGKEEGVEKPRRGASLRGACRRRADRAGHALLGHQLRSARQRSETPATAPSPRGRSSSLGVEGVNECRRRRRHATFSSSPIQVSRFARRRCARRASKAGTRAPRTASPCFATARWADYSIIQAFAREATTGRR